MSNAIEFVSFNLKVGSSVPDFLLASDKLNNTFLSAQKGYISRKLLVNDGLWADFVVWETMDDALNAMRVCHEDASAVEYMAFIENENLHHFFVEKDY